ncbi:MAG: tetratricopeptide repeat protein [Candidatus Melainabacteria bacterium]|jgi:tetratricopeptide (TPR) repeat protein|nr:tetratricopeptide repeat protein [Candidatus Melainabacteria bacterium]
MNRIHLTLKSKQAKTCILTAALVAISSMQFAIAQTQHWRTAAREKSQRMASSAQNQLVLSNADAAIPLLQEGTRADATDPLPFLLLGMALNMKGRYQEALDALKQSYALDSKARETYLTVGFSHYLSHRYEQAVGVWNKVLQANPDAVPIYTNIGFALLRDGKMEEAENSLRECAKRSTYSGASYRGLMLLHYLNGNFPIARSAAQQAGSAGGKQVPLILAEMDFLEGNAKLAAKQIASLPKPSKKSKPSFDMVSIGYLPQHDFHFDPFSTDYFDNESLIEARFVDLPKRESRRVQLAKKGAADSALSNVRTALSTAPNDPYLIFQSGAIRLAAGDYPSASQDFAKVIGRAPDWHLAKLYLALSRFREGKVDAAKTALEGFERSCPGRQLAPLFALIKNADAQAGQAAAAEQKDEQFTLPDDAKNRPPSKGDAGF